MNLSRGDYKRFVLVSIATLLLVSSSTAWHSLGYLNPLAWILEWGDVILSFFFLYISLRLRPVYRVKYLTIIVVISAAFGFLSLYPVLNFEITNSINPFYFVTYCFPVLAVISIFFLIKRGKLNLKLESVMFLLIVEGSIMFLSYLFYTVSPTFPTDESLFNLYSAHLFLQGLNPYTPNLVANSFSYFGFQLNGNSPITPITSGGYVNSMTYPALSFLVFVPAYLFHIKSALIMLPFFSIPLLLVWYKGWKNEDYISSILSLIPFLILVLYTYQAGSAETDILWVIFLLSSYYTLPKVKESGILFGLSFSVKQFPIFAGPFFMYFVIKEHGFKKGMIWLTFAIIAFLIVNGYFILNGPSNFFNSILSNEFEPLLGVGYSFAQISFLNVLPIPRSFFSILLLTAFGIFIMLYVWKYPELKFLLFAFPIIIFLFNYRLFSQYLFYWLIISLLPLMDRNKFGEMTQPKDLKLQFKGKLSRKARILMAVAVGVLVISSATAFHYTLESSPGKFEINSLKIVNSNLTGYSSDIVINLSFNSNTLSSSHVLFRVITPGSVSNSNMYLWHPADQNITINANEMRTISVIPDYPEYSVNINQSFLIIAYFGEIQGSYYYHG